MRAMVIHGFGGPEVLVPGEIEIPVPGPGEVLIRVAYASVNPADWKAREGWLSRYFEYKFPFVVGFDAAGLIAGVGEGVTDYKIGDRVVTSSNQGIGERGSYAEYLKVVTDRVSHIADSVDFATAASIPTAAVTSWEGLFGTGDLKPGQTVLINGGAGGMGSFAIQFAKNAGVKVAVTCGPKNIDYVKSLGADLAIDYRSQDVLEAVLAWAPGGVDVIMDTVGQGSLQDGIAMTKPGGIIAPIGTLIPDEPQFDAVAAEKRNVRIVPTMSNRMKAGDYMRHIVDLFGKGVFRAPELTGMPLEQADEAHRMVKDGHVRGKIVLHVADL
ncbi:MAG: alcohol dehydrogenase [Rhodospirillales bacterium]|nr:alcohol dehydrogenase [Rhodospirillales bacterium]